MYEVRGRHLLARTISSTPVLEQRQSAALLVTSAEYEHFCSVTQKYEGMP